MKFTKIHAAAAVATIAVLATGGVASAAVASSNQALQAVGPLQPAQVQYKFDVWGNATSGQNNGAGLVPKGWSKVLLAKYETKYTSTNGVWNLRAKYFDKAERRVKTQDDRLSALHKVKGYKLISKTIGTVRSTNPSDPALIDYTTIVYTYSDGARGTRMVVDRIAGYRGETTTAFELAAGGRPQDRAGLESITSKATGYYVQLP